jgi:predicted ATP-dependent endonuclease of OLD family
MKKLAIYVEGQTEQIFVSKLIKEIADKNHLTIQLAGINYDKKLSTVENIINN